MSDDDPQERRATPRIGVPVDVLLIRGEERLPFAVRDLSVGGARLVGHARVVEGERVRVELVFADARVTVTAEVVRSDPQHSQVALAFGVVPPETVQLIERELATLMKNAQAEGRRYVAALGLSQETIDVLARDLAQLGRRLASYDHMQDVMAALAAEPAPRCEAVILAAGASDTAPLLRWLAEHHPRARRVLLHGEQLASLDHESSARVEAVLRTPWRIRSLARGLGIAMPDTSMALLPPDD